MRSSEDLTGQPQRWGHDDGRDGGHDDEGGEQQQTPASDPAPVASVIPTPADRLGVVRQQQAQPGSDREDAEGQDGEHDTGGDDLDRRLALEPHHQRDDRGGDADQGGQHDAARQQPGSEGRRILQHRQGSWWCPGRRRSWTECRPASRRPRQPGMRSGPCSENSQSCTLGGTRNQASVTSTALVINASGISNGGRNTRRYISATADRIVDSLATGHDRRSDQPGFLTRASRKCPNTNCRSGDAYPPIINTHVRRRSPRGHKMLRPSLVLAPTSLIDRRTLLPVDRVREAQLVVARSYHTGP